MGKEILARLNCKTQSFSDGGGHSTLAVSDIAAACSDADPLGVSILLHKVCGDRSQHPMIFYSLYQDVITIVAKYGWKGGRKERFRDITNLAIFETMNKEVCPVCKGSGRDPLKPVRKCRSGVISDDVCRPVIFDKDRAQALRISPSAWCQTWGGRYEKLRERVKMRIECAEPAAMRSIYEKLRND